MAGFWSVVGLAIKSLFAGQDANGHTGDDVTSDSDVTTSEPEPSYRYAIARFSGANPANANPANASAAAGATPTSPEQPDAIANILSRSLASIPDSQVVLVNQFFAPNPDVADPFQAIRETKLGALNVAHQRDAQAMFWGRQNDVTGQLEVHLISDELASSLYGLIMPLTHCFKLPEHHDTTEALRILLSAELVHQARGSEMRSQQMARLTSHLEDLLERIQKGDTFDAAGPGVATAYAFAAYVLAETGDRKYCATAMRVIEPQIRQILKAAGDQPVEKATVKAAAPSGLLGEKLHHKEVVVKEASTEELIAGISDFDKVDCQKTAILALYGGLVNWSLVSNMQAGTGTLAIALWKFLVRRFELTGGSAADCATAICRVGEALVAHAKETENAKLADSGVVQFRRAIGMISNRSHAALYAIAAYGLAESIVASALINDIHIPDEQVIPVYQASLKVCARRDQPYIWGRTMFALASVQLMNGSQGKDAKMTGLARVSFSQAYEAFTDAGAKGAARAASGGYTRAENMLSQLSHRKAVMDATGGENNQESTGS